MPGRSPMGWPGRSACPEATAGPNPFRGRPSGLTRWRCGSAGGGVITCPSVARQGSSKGRPGGEMQSGTSARHYLFARGSEEGSNSASARGPEKAARRSLPGGAAVRQVGESLCASSVVRKAAEPAKNRPPAARPECMPGGNRRPQPLPWQTVGAYPVALRFGRRGSNYVSVCGPAG